ncbi:alpha/beta hydrolase [Paraglaciecola sp.]|uniref:alpha/beta fold hydrolase n=1 Tax=Paraglaciecola sp. TaxID=1920173 RepID=UPI003263C157
MLNPNASPFTIDHPVIFFPGTLCDERIFTPCWQHLNISKRAFVPLQWAQNLEQMRMLSADRLNYFEEPVHLVGFSMGAYIAALTAVEFKSCVASVTLIGSSCNALSTSILAQRKQTLKLIQNKQFKGSAEKHLIKYFHDVNQKGKCREVVKDMERDLGIGVLEAQLKAIETRQNLFPKLAECCFPIHFIVGEQDNLVNLTELAIAVASLQQAQMTKVKDAGHMLPLEQPIALAQRLANFIV